MEVKCTNCGETIPKDHFVLDVVEDNVDGIQTKETCVSGHVCPECGCVENYD